MAERVTTVRLRAEIADLKRQMAEAGVAVKGVGDQAEKAAERSNAALSSLSNTAGLLGAAMVAAAGVAVMAFANFDQSMSNVEAATHESVANMALLRDAAIDAGKRTVFSATESAGAIEELAKAGISTADVLGGALTGSLDLAAAGSLGVSEAAETMSVTLQQFKLPGTEAVHVADLLAAGAGKAMGSVSDLGMALRQAGQVANSTGLTIEETTAGLAAFASAGLLGSDAGTSFKAMLQRLTPQSAEAQTTMDELGISAYDAQGNFIGLAEFSGNLRESMKDLTPEARNAAMTVMFGSDAVRAATVLYDQGAKGINEWTEKVDDSGYAAETAAIKLDNLKGDFEQLSGSVETALIGLGEGANGPLRELTQGATDMVNAFADAPDAVQGVTLALIGGGGLVLLGIAGLGKLVVFIRETKVALDALKISGKTAGLAIGGIGVALTVASLGLMAWAENAAAARARTEELQDTLDELGNVTDDTLSSINESLSKNRNDWLDSIFGQDPESLIDRAEKFGLAIEDLQGYILGEADALDRVSAATDAYLEANDSTNRERNAARGEIRELVNNLDAEAGSLTAAEKAAAQKAAADETAGIAAEDLADATEDTTVALVDQTDALGALIDAQNEAAGVVLSERDAQRQLQAAIDEANESVGKQIDELAAQYEAQGLSTDAARAQAEAEVAVADKLDITTEAGRRNQSALDDIASAGWDLIDSMQANGSTQGELQTSMSASRDAFILAAEAMGMGSEEANRLADEMGMIPTQIGITIGVDTTNARIELDRFIRLASGMKVYVDVEGRTTGFSTGRGNAPGSATGGAIYGPGTGTSDSIDARLSNGEHVLTADDVNDLGGQAAVYRMRSLAQAGMLRFAAGGAVKAGGSDARHFFDNLNAQRFATGGYVGATPAAPAAMAFPDTVRLDPSSVQAVAEAIVTGAERVSSGVLGASARHQAAMQHTRGSTW